MLHHTHRQVTIMDQINVVITGGNAEARLLVAAIIEQGLTAQQFTQISNLFVTLSGRTLKAAEVSTALSLIQRREPDLVDTAVVIRGAHDKSTE